MDSDPGPSFPPRDPPPGGRIQLLGQPGALRIVLPPRNARKMAFHALLSTIAFGAFAVMCWVVLVVALIDPDRSREKILLAGFLGLGSSVGTWLMATAALSLGPGRFEIEQDGEDLVLRTTWRGRAIGWSRLQRSQLSLVESETGAPVATLELKTPRKQVNLDYGLEQAEVEWLRRMLAAMLSGAL